jgi:hypothetical protein
VDRRAYRVLEGPLEREDLGLEALKIRDLFTTVKKPIDLSEDQVLQQAREIPEVKAWLASGACLGVRLEPDQERATYYSVDLFKWCDGEQAESSAGFLVDKQTGRIRSPQGLRITTTYLPNIRTIRTRLTDRKSTAQKQLETACSAISR